MTRLTTQMKSVGEVDGHRADLPGVPAARRCARLETGLAGCDPIGAPPLTRSSSALTSTAPPDAGSALDVAEAFRARLIADARSHELTEIDPWFLRRRSPT